ncbi:hypothetical protein LUX33_01295 [Actinomadura madurae]|uniref:hypothetical protein n=1 Tax=Actinomadura madurae TaxID=1993 RepID=UPI0020D2534B|nr:hypothetical protein [Actinomadura madurae]MCP9947229.1 hypothetical protein [Actinomadura madurae]
MSAEPVDLDAVTRLLTGLPRGPWHVEYFGDDGYPQRIANAGAVIVAETHQGGTGLRPTPEFIAQARTLVPRMADEIAALRGENARLREGEDATPRDPGCEPTPGQWLHRFNSAAPAQRLTWAKDILRHARDSSRCQFELDHAARSPSYAPTCSTSSGRCMASNSPSAMLPSPRSTRCAPGSTRPPTGPSTSSATSTA